MWPQYGATRLKKPNWDGQIDAPPSASRASVRLTPAAVENGQKLPLSRDPQGFFRMSEG